MKGGTRLWLSWHWSERSVIAGAAHLYCTGTSPTARAMCCRLSMGPHKRSAGHAQLPWCGAGAWASGWPGVECPGWRLQTHPGPHRILPHPGPPWRSATAASEGSATAAGKDATEVLVVFMVFSI